MKITIKKIASLFSICLTLFALSSCEKDDVDESGFAQLKIVNASPGSGEQGFYLLGNVIRENLDFSAYSDYTDVSSGNRLTAAFKSQDTGTETAAGELWMGNTERYTVYLVGSGSNKRIKQFEDNLSSPSSGKAKIKFIHLSDGISSDVRIRDNSGSEIVNNLSRNLESSYKTISPGTFSFSLYGTGSGDLIKSFDIVGIEAGKIYAIYFSGGSAAALQANKVNY